jgi:hypothetical protein
MARKLLLLVLAIVLLSAQTMPDPSKLAPVYQQQRNAEADGRAQCVAIVVDLQTKIADLEKQLAAKDAK